MKDSTLTGVFPYGNNPQWGAQNGEGVNVVSQSPNEMAQEEWNEWMGWDASQGPSPKSFNVQGLYQFLRLEKFISSLLNAQHVGHVLTSKLF